MTDDDGFGIYLHWPFCAQKCPYCDFNSHVRHGGWDEARFLAAFRTELTAMAERQGLRSQRPPVQSIFFGGGTPSLMQPGTVAGLLDHIATLWTIACGAEATLEANPNSVEAGRFQGYRAAGVNRVSIGVQSFDDGELKRLGRLHSAAEARGAIDIAGRVFERVSFDLIYARPGQTPVKWRAELREALNLARGHLSLYQLTIEPDTPFAELHARGKLVVPDPDAALTLYEITQELTDTAGLRAYEISNHARPGEESRHNLLYWRYGAYAGAGPGAHGRLVSDGRRLATSTERNPERWLARVEAHGQGMIEETPLGQAEQADEMLMMGLRLSEGLDLGRLARVTGFRPTRVALDRLVRQGFLEFVPDSPDRVRASGRGRFVLNEIVFQLSQGLQPVAAAVL
ncbi:MAG: radical SAM family heme chaperone HemW [Hyphomicrobium sp.]|nr:radical SAM family heme chaperone HemW [Hyphomicrobium sp.]